MIPSDLRTIDTQRGQESGGRLKNLDAETSSDTRLGPFRVNSGLEASQCIDSGDVPLFCCSGTDRIEQRQDFFHAHLPSSSRPDSEEARVAWDTSIHMAGDRRGHDSPLPPCPPGRQAGVLPLVLLGSIKCVRQTTIGDRGREEGAGREEECER